MFLGLICTVLFIIASLRFVERRVVGGKGKFFKRLHVPVSILLIIATIGHIVDTWHLLNQRFISLFITGFIAAFFILGAIVSGFMIGRVGKSKRLMRWHRIATLFAAIFILLHGVTMLTGVATYQNQVRNIVVEHMDLANIPDGVYVGEYDVTYVFARVEVTVHLGEITNIEILEHRPGDGHGLPAEAIVDTIQEKQRIDVDTIAGATNSSRVLQAAIMDALKSGYELY